jgi:hypothetical protein
MQITDKMKSLGPWDRAIIFVSMAHMQAKVFLFAEGKPLANQIETIFNLVGLSEGIVDTDHFKAGERLSLWLEEQGILNDDTKITILDASFAKGEAAGA